MNAVTFIFELLTYVFILGTVAVIVFLGGGLVLYCLKRRQTDVQIKLPDSAPDSYERRTEFVHGPARAFYAVLSTLVDTELRLFAKVRMSDVVRVKENLPSPLTFLDAIEKVRFDFLLCDPEYLKPMLAISLDDPALDSPELTQQRKFVDEVMNNVGIPFLRFPAKSGYTCAELEQSIVRAMDHGAVPREASAPATASVS